MEYISDANNRISKEIFRSRKSLWKGKFNYNEQHFTLYTQTYARDHVLAFYNFCYQLTERLEMSYKEIRDYFLNHSNKYNIKKINRKDKEVITK